MPLHRVSSGPRASVVSWCGPWALGYAIAATVRAAESFAMSVAFHPSLSTVFLDSIATPRIPCSRFNVKSIMVSSIE